MTVGKNHFSFCHDGSSHLGVVPPIRSIKRQYWYIHHLKRKRDASHKLSAAGWLLMNDVCLFEKCFFSHHDMCVPLIDTCFLSIFLVFFHWKIKLFTAHTHNTHISTYYQNVIQWPPSLFFLYKLYISGKTRRSRSQIRRRRRRNPLLLPLQTLHLRRNPPRQGHREQDMAWTRHRRGAYPPPSRTSTHPIPNATGKNDEGYCQSCSWSADQIGA